MDIDGPRNNNGGDLSGIVAVSPGPVQQGISTTPAAVIHDTPAPAAKASTTSTSGVGVIGSPYSVGMAQSQGGPTIESTQKVDVGGGMYQYQAQLSTGDTEMVGRPQPIKTDSSGSNIAEHYDNPVNVGGTTVSFGNIGDPVLKSSSVFGAAVGQGVKGFDIFVGDYTARGGQSDVTTAYLKPNQAVEYLPDLGTLAVEHPERFVPATPVTNAGFITGQGYADLQTGMFAEPWTSNIKTAGQLNVMWDPVKSGGGNSEGTSSPTMRDVKIQSALVGGTGETPKLGDVAPKDTGLFAIDTSKAPKLTDTISWGGKPETVDDFSYSLFAGSRGFTEMASSGADTIQAVLGKGPAQSAVGGVLMFGATAFPSMGELAGGFLMGAEAAGQDVYGTLARGEKFSTPQAFGDVARSVANDITESWNADPIKTGVTLGLSAFALGKGAYDVGKAGLVAPKTIGDTMPDTRGITATAKGAAASGIRASIGDATTAAGRVGDAILTGYSKEAPESYGTSPSYYRNYYPAPGYSTYEAPKAGIVDRILQGYSKEAPESYAPPKPAATPDFTVLDSKVGGPTAAETAVEQGRFEQAFGQLGDNEPVAKAMDNYAGQIRPEAPKTDFTGYSRADIDAIAKGRSGPTAAETAAEQGRFEHEFGRLGDNEPVAKPVGSYAGQIRPEAPRTDFTGYSRAEIDAIVAEQRPKVYLADEVANQVGNRDAYRYWNRLGDLETEPAKPRVEFNPETGEQLRVERIAPKNGFFKGLVSQKSFRAFVADERGTVGGRRGTAGGRLELIMKPAVEEEVPSIDLTGRDPFEDIAAGMGDADFGQFLVVSGARLFVNNRQRDQTEMQGILSTPNYNFGAVQKQSMFAETVPVQGQNTLTETVPVQGQKYKPQSQPQPQASLDTSLELASLTATAAKAKNKPPTLSVLKPDTSDRAGGSGKPKSHYKNRWNLDWTAGHGIGKNSPPQTAAAPTEADHRSAMSRRLAEIHGRVIGNLDGYRVVEKSGPAIRKIHVDFIGGTNHSADPSIARRGEVIVEKTATKRDEMFIASHEVVEETMMRKHGYSYPAAHKVANRVEGSLRRANPHDINAAVKRRLASIEARQPDHTGYGTANGKAPSASASGGSGLQAAAKGFHETFGKKLTREIEHGNVGHEFKFTKYRAPKPGPGNIGLGVQPKPRPKPKQGNGNGKGKNSGGMGGFKSISLNIGRSFKSMGKRARGKF